MSFLPAPAPSKPRK